MVAETTWGRLVSLEDALDEAAYNSHSLIRITAAVAGGKTEFIVRKAAQLVEQGIDPAKILCVVSSPTAGYRLRDRLVGAHENLASCVIHTPLALCMSLLTSEAARAYTQRQPRLLGGAEFNMVLEDTKRQASSLALVRSMLAKAFTGLGALAPQDSWGLEAEEAVLYDHMRSHVQFIDAILREEAPALAASFIQSDDASRGMFDAVFIDDAHNISEATFEVCKLISSSFVVACGNPNQAQAGFDRNASTRAFETMADDALCLHIKDGVQQPSIAAFCDALCTREAMDDAIQAARQSDGLPNEDALTCIKWHEPEDEFKGVAHIVRTLMAKREGTDPGDIFVLVPNRAWAGAISQCLADRRVDNVVMLDADPISGDPRSQDPTTLDAYCRLALAANKDDAAAWRLWCGLGDKTCRVDAWAAFKAWAESMNMGVAQGLEALQDYKDDPFEGASIMRKRYREGCEMCEGLSQRKGFALLKALATNPAAKQVAHALEPIDGDEDASTLHRRLVEISLEPYFIPNPHRVAIGSYKLIQGLDPRHVIACGLIEGYIPAISHADLVEFAPATQAKLAAARRNFYNAIGKARETLVLSTIQRAGTDLAHKLRMDARRIKREHGREVAVLARSCFIDEAGDAAPSTVSGEQFLAEEDEKGK